MLPSPVCCGSGCQLHRKLTSCPPVKVRTYLLCFCCSRAGFVPCCASTPTQMVLHHLLAAGQSQADQYSSHTGKVPQKINTVISWAPSPGNRVGCWSASEGRFSAGLSHLVNWWSVPMPFPAVVRLFPKHRLYPSVIWEFWGRIHPDRREGGCYNYQINQAATMTETLNCSSFLCKL